MASDAIWEVSKVSEFIYLANRHDSPGVKGKIAHCDRGVSSCDDQVTFSNCDTIVGNDNVSNVNIP